MKSRYKILRIFRAGNVLEDFFPKIAEFFVGDGAACAEQAVMLALPDVIKGEASKPLRW